MIDVAGDVAADRRVARPPVVDVEDPDAVARQVAPFTAPRFRLRDELALVLDDERVLGDWLRGIDAPAPIDGGSAVDDRAPGIVITPAATRRGASEVRHVSPRATVPHCGAGGPDMSGVGSTITPQSWDR
jgi:hypothetical protein